MASLYRRLHGLFRTSPATTHTNTPKSLPNDDSIELKLQKLINNFKKSSESYRFRSRHDVYEKTVRRLASAKRFSCIEDILEHQKQFKDITTEGFAIRLISLYGKSSMFDHAFKVFDEMPQLKCDRTVKSFNALLAACVNSKRFDMVDQCFRELPSKLSINPNVVSYNTVIKAFCEMGSLDSALSMLDEMENCGLDPDLITFNTLLDVFYRNSRFSDGEKIWALMESKNVVPNIRTYNAKLRGIGFEKRMSEAVELVEEIGTVGLKLDVFSFNALIGGFCNEGNLEEAKRSYDKLAKSDCSPDRATFATLVPFVYEKGDYDLALEMCKEAIRRRCIVDAALLQLVIEGLVKNSMIEEAKKLVELGKLNNYSGLSLVVSLDT